MAHMAPWLELIDYTQLRLRHITQFHMAPYGTTWRSCANNRAIRNEISDRMARVKSRNNNNGAICAICAI